MSDFAVNQQNVNVPEIKMQCLKFEYENKMAKTIRRKLQSWYKTMRPKLLGWNKTMRPKLQSSRKLLQSLREVWQHVSDELKFPNLLNMHPDSRWISMKSFTLLFLRVIHFRSFQYKTPCKTHFCRKQRLSIFPIHLLCRIHWIVETDEFSVNKKRFSQIV